MVKRDKCMGVSQLLGARARAAPKSTPMLVAYYVIEASDLQTLYSCNVMVNTQVIPTYTGR